jgi:hypothetical protein
LTGNSGLGNSNFIGTTDTSALEIRVNNSRVVRYEYNLLNYVENPNIIGGSPWNRVMKGVVAATIGGGGAFGVGTGHYVTDVGGTIGGGGSNTVGNEDADPFDANFATVSGGDYNGAAGLYSAVGGGYFNRAFGMASTISGGYGNRADGGYAVVPGGNLNSAGGDYSFAGGYRAFVRKDPSGGDKGTFVWSDASSGAGFSSTGPNQFLVRTAGGMGINTNSPNAALHAKGNGRILTLEGDGTSYMEFFSRGIAAGRTSYVGFGESPGTLNFTIVNDNPDGAIDLVPGAQGVNVMRGYLMVKGAGDEQVYLGGDGNGSDVEIGSRNPSVANVGFWNSATSQHMNLFAKTFNVVSDRNEKANFASVDVDEILNRVVRMPITRWNYRHEPAVEHLGPVAQDFRAAFGLGADEKHIATVDADGVALAAIQGLYAKLEKQQEIIDRQRDIVERQQRMIDELRILVQRQEMPVGQLAPPEGH